MSENFSIDVYIAEIPTVVERSTLTNQQREREIAACTSPKVQREKYCVWKLLEYAAYQSFGIKADVAVFKKNDNGKWTSPNFYFSLSHSHNAVAVAVSSARVGVDIECFSGKFWTIKDKYLTAEEKMEFNVCQEEERLAFLAEKWTRKESVFKADIGILGTAFQPKKIQTNEYNTYSQRIDIGDRQYMLSVAADTIDEVRLYKVAEYLK